MNLFNRFISWLATPGPSDFDRGYLWAEKELAKGRHRWEISFVREREQTDEFERGVTQCLADHAIKERLAAVKKMKDMS